MNPYRGITLNNALASRPTPPLGQWFQAMADMSRFSANGADANGQAFVRRGWAIASDQTSRGVLIDEAESVARPTRIATDKSEHLTREFAELDHH